MTLPTHTVELALSTRPTEAPNWVDVTAYVLEWQCHRGRQHELDQIQAGTATVVLDNSDRRFDPTYTGSPYYGQMKPLRRLRISATWNGHLYRLFTGYVDDWGQDYKGHGTDHRAPLHATDAFKILNLRKLSKAYAQENSGARINHVLDDVSWTSGLSWIVGSATNAQLGSTTVVGPVGDRHVDVGVSLVQAVTLTEVPALSHIRDALNAENGVFYIGADGSAIFKNRHASIHNSGAQVVFGDADGEINYSDVSISYEETHLWNDIRVTRAGSQTALTASDATSQLDYFPRSYARASVPLDGVSAAAADSEAQSMAIWLLRQYKDPEFRVTGMSFQANGNDAAWPYLLGLDLLDRALVRRRPFGGDGVIEQLSEMESVTHKVTGARWTVDMVFAPADDISYWMLGVAGSGQLGSTTIPAY